MNESIKNQIRAFLKAYGENFRNLRRERNIGQKEVAKRLEISQAIISHIENGLFLPPRRA